MCTFVVGDQLMDRFWLGPVFVYWTLTIIVSIAYCRKNCQHDYVIKMETFSALQSFVRGIHRSPVDFPSQSPVTQSFDVSFDVRLIKRLNKQSRCWWFETPWPSLWRHSNELFMYWIVLWEHINRNRCWFFITHRCGNWHPSAWTKGIS